MAKKRFIFDENYNKKRRKIDKQKWLILGAIVLGVILVATIIIIAATNRKPKNNKPIFELKEELTIESGSYLPAISSYFNVLENIKEEDIKIEYPSEFELSYDLSACSEQELEAIAKGEISQSASPCAKQNLVTPATYGVTIYLDKKEYTVLLKVVDTTAPILMLKNVERYKENTAYTEQDFVSICFDINGECEIHFENEEYANITNAGEHEVKLVASDKYGNKTEPVSATLTIIEPVKPIYKVTFKSDGETYGDIISLEEGSLVSEPKINKNGYKFLGWYNGNQLFDFKAPITNDLTLEAKWEEIITDPDIPDVPKPVVVTSIFLDFVKINLNPNETKTVIATVRPSNAINKEVTWSTSDENIATVDNGRITGKNPGTATITATAGGISTTLEVVVRVSSTGSCKYGDTNYDKNRFDIISQDLTQNNCAIDPNITPDSPIGENDHSALVNEINAKGYNLKVYTPNYYKVKNNAGTGVIGYQIAVYVKATDSAGKEMESFYILKPDGTRVYTTNKNEINLR